MREKYLPMLSFEVGDGRSIFLWHNQWHPRGPLLKFYGPTILYGSGTSTNAKLSTMIYNGYWKWPAARSRNHADMRSLLPNIAPNGVSDTIKWLGNFSYAFQSNKT